MAKTQEELVQLKQEYETLNSKLKELTEDELKLVTGGSYLAEAKCQAQEAEDHIPEEHKSIPQPNKTIGKQERHQYKDSGNMSSYRCKVCETVSVDWNTILDHVKNAHNGDSNMIETIEF